VHHIRTVFVLQRSSVGENLYDQHSYPCPFVSATVAQTVIGITVVPVAGTAPAQQPYESYLAAWH